MFILKSGTGLKIREGSHKGTRKTIKERICEKDVI